MPRRFWTSARRPPPGHDGGAQQYPADGKDLLFESMYSVCIENLPEQDYFTEKILDAFATFTVPVYCGCPNIAQYFDPAGMICVASAEELIDRCNRLTVDDYWARMPALLDNFRRSQEYADGLVRLRTAIVSQASGSAKLEALWTSGGRRV